MVREEGEGLWRNGEEEVWEVDREGREGRDIVL